MIKKATSIENLLKIVGRQCIPTKELLFAKNYYKVSCIGKLHSGKSTLLNQIIGRELLPTGMEADGVTSFPMFIYKGQTDAIIISTVTGNQKSFSDKNCWKEAAKYLCTLSRKQMPFVCIELPCTSQIPDSLLLIDAPGLDGSPWAELDSENEYQCVRNNHWILSFSDLAIFCGSYRELCTQERDILQPYSMSKILVISHCDEYYNDEDDLSNLYDFEHTHEKIHREYVKLRELIETNAYSNSVIEKLDGLKIALTNEELEYKRVFFQQLIDKFCKLHQNGFDEVYFTSPFFCPLEKNCLSRIGQEGLEKLKKRVWTLCSRSKGKRECIDPMASLISLEKQIGFCVSQVESTPIVEQMLMALQSELSYARKAGFFSKKIEDILKKLQKGHLLG